MTVLAKIAQVARAMRTAQKGYFATGSAQRLSESKGLERRLDELLEQDEQEAKGIVQGTLFDFTESEQAPADGRAAQDGGNTVNAPQVHTGGPL